MNEKLECRLGVAQGIAGAVLGGVVLGVSQQVLDMVAGRTVYALLGFWVAGGLGVAAGALVVCAVRRKAGWGAGCAALAFFALGVWLVVQLSLEGMLQTGFGSKLSGWHHFQLSANRSFAMYLWLLAKTAGLTVLVPAVLVACVVQGGQGGQAGAGRVGRAAGWLLVLCGYLATDFFLCPGRLFVLTTGWFAKSGISPEVLTRMATLCMGVLAGVSVLRKCERLSGAWIFSAVFPLGAIIGLIVLLLPGQWKNPLSADGVFGRLACRDSGFGMGTPDKVYAVGGGHTVVRYEDADYGFVGALDGRALMFGNRFATARTLMGYAPMLVHPQAQKTALAGTECGVYLPFFLRADMTNVTVEVSGITVFDSVRLTEPFYDMNHEITKVDKYTLRHYVTAPRYVPVRVQKPHDIILVAPEPGWVRGSAKVYSPAALRRYREALAEDGVVALRVDGRALSEARFAAIARDFMAVFPGVQVWSVGAADWLLIGGKQKLTATMDNIVDVLGKDWVFEDLVRAGNMGLPEMLACMVCDGQGLAEWLKGRGTETACAALWRGPRRVITGENLLAPALEPVRQPGTDWVLPGEMDEEIYAGVMERAGEVRDARCLMVRALADSMEGRHEESFAAMRVAAKITHRDALLMQIVDQLDLDARRRVRFGDYRGGQMCYEKLIALSAGAARYHHGLGTCLRASGDVVNAYRHFARAVGASSAPDVYRLDLAQAAVAVGEFAEADRQYREVLRREPDNPDVHLLFAKGLIAKTRPEKDFGQAVKLAERACELTQWKNKGIAYELADIYIEAGQVLEGVGLKRRLKDQGEAKESPPSK